MVGLLGQIGKSFAQFRDDRGAGQAKKRVDLPLDFERRCVGAVGVLARELVEHLPGSLIVGLAIQRETQIVFDVIVPRINQCRLEQLGELLRALDAHAPVGGIAGLGYRADDGGFQNVVVNGAFAIPSSSP